jgi:hypothetical protein
MDTEGKGARNLQVEHFERRDFERRFFEKRYVERRDYQPRHMYGRYRGVRNGGAGEQRANGWSR